MFRSYTEYYFENYRLNYFLKWKQYTFFLSEMVVRGVRGLGWLDKTRISYLVVAAAVVVGRLDTVAV